MRGDQARHLCLDLIRCDLEEEVIALLKEAGFWENESVWRYYGDYEGNFNTIGNQQGRPDAALVEKLVNSVDACLMNECLARGIDPEGPSAPQTIREAVALFFEDNPNPKHPRAGQIKNWSNQKRLATARSITLAATGPTAKEGDPCFSIADCGEGQTPDMMPVTFLSLTKSNKLRIPFVQGKFNMGGTGVLKFCGRNNLQLILSRRNPALVDPHSSRPSDSQWGFTVVRREDPEGGRRSSVYVYLAPVDAEIKPGKGGILRFGSNRLPIFPEGRDPYTRESEFGTLIKLYEYSLPGFKTHILRKDGLLSRVDLLLPDIALPLRFHECRQGYRGHEGSFETTLTGIAVRLEEDRSENLEEDFPSSAQMSAQGEVMAATIYAFKRGRADTYRKNEGVIFTLNGQTHGHLTVDFFRRKNVGLSYLADSVLVVVDCSQFSGRAREDLFMNSRDRLSGGELRREIEHVLEEMLKHHSGLRALKECRRREDVEAKLEDNKPLEDVLNSLLQRYPALSGLFLPGKASLNPFKSKLLAQEDKPYKGRRYPTFFKFKHLPYGQELKRDCHINMRSRVTFETDAANDYFDRDEDKGEFKLLHIRESSIAPVETFSVNLQNGIATLNLRLPEDCSVGDLLHFRASITDATRLEPFENSMTVTVKKEVEVSGGEGSRRKPPSKEPGKEREQTAGIQLPAITEVYEQEWSQKDPPFDKFTALRIKHAGEQDSSTGDVANIYDFFVNMDNVYLKSELRVASSDPQLLRARFKLGLVLIGLALLQKDIQSRSKAEHTEESEEEENEINIEDMVSKFTEAVSPVLLPMIDFLGDLDAEESTATIASGESV